MHTKGAEGNRHGCMWGIIALLAHLRRPALLRNRWQPGSIPTVTRPPRRSNPPTQSTSQWPPLTQSTPTSSNDQLSRLHHIKWSRRTKHTHTSSPSAFGSAARQISRPQTSNLSIKRNPTPLHRVTPHALPIFPPQAVSPTAISWQVRRHQTTRTLVHTAMGLRATVATLKNRATGRLQGRGTSSHWSRALIDTVQAHASVTLLTPVQGVRRTNM